MNKELCRGIVIVLTCVSDSRDKTFRSTEDEGGDYVCENLHDGRKLIKKI